MMKRLLQPRWTLLKCIPLVAIAACSQPSAKTSGMPDAATSMDASMNMATMDLTMSLSGDNIGVACTADADCGQGLRCSTAAGNEPAFGGGPANGYCTLSCQQDADCPGFATACLLPSQGSTGVCVLTCAIGPPLMYINDPFSGDGKCGERDDVACTPIDQAGTVTACLPACGKDSQCPAGRHCDPRAGICVDMAHTGDSPGAKCDPMAMTPTCAGLCVNFTGGQSMCSSGCPLGGDTPYLSTPSCGGLTSGICLFSPQGNGAGDFGFCAPACSTQSDCLQFPTFVCTPLKGLTGAADGVPNGFCLSGTPCPNGNADCTMATGTACVQTASGPQCLSSAIPLGGEAPDGGAGDGGP